jgi:chromosomal replication initiation ATPase DnaA
LNFTASELTILKESVRADILSLIEKQTHENIKSDGGQLSTVEIVSELHKQIAIRIEIIRKLEADWIAAYVDGR